MKITARLIDDPCQFVRFEWSADLETVEVSQLGPVANDDATLTAMLDANVHEGADLDGWTVTID